MIGYSLWDICLDATPPLTTNSCQKLSMLPLFFPKILLQCVSFISPLYFRTSSIIVQYSSMVVANIIEYNSHPSQKDSPSHQCVSGQYDPPPTDRQRCCGVYCMHLVKNKNKHLLYITYTRLTIVRCIK